MLLEMGRKLISIWLVVGGLFGIGMMLPIHVFSIDIVLIGFLCLLASIIGLSIGGW